MSRHRYDRADDAARRAAYRAQLDDIRARRPLLRRWLHPLPPPPSWLSAAIRAALAWLWKETLGRVLFAKLHLDADAAYAEAAALRLVRTHASRVPVPRVWAIVPPWLAGGDHYVLMSRVRALDLGSLWPVLSDAERDATLDALRPLLDDLRAIPRPPLLSHHTSRSSSGSGDSESESGGIICSATGGPVHDPRLPAHGARGPFTSESAFNAALRGLEPLTSPALPASVREAHARTHAVVFTHGDLAPRNILVDLVSVDHMPIDSHTSIDVVPANYTSIDRDEHTRTPRPARRVRIRAIVDWDAAGWFPEYWEYRKARWAVTATSSPPSPYDGGGGDGSGGGGGSGDADDLARGWIDRLPRALDPYPLEADADDFLFRRFWAPS